MPTASATGALLLLDVDAHDALPLSGDERLGRIELRAGWEHGAGDVGQLGLEVCRDDIPLDEVVEACRVAVPREPIQLALVRVQEVHVRLRGVRVWRKGADRL